MMNASAPSAPARRRPTTTITREKQKPELPSASAGTGAPDARVVLARGGVEEARQEVSPVRKGWE